MWATELFKLARQNECAVCGTFEEHISRSALRGLPGLSVLRPKREKKLQPLWLLAVCFYRADLILFPEGSLKNCNGTVIPQSQLKGKSVALYFADGADPKCTSFLPFLLNVSPSNSVFLGPRTVAVRR